MWWRLAVLGTATLGLLVLLFAPIGTVTIKLDLPPGVPGPSNAEMQAVSGSVVGATDAVSYFVAGLIICAAVGLGLRIVRRYRRAP
jgi:hypothetical protein